MQIAQWTVALLTGLFTLRTSAQNCLQLAGDNGCDFYTLCLESAIPCGPRGYALGYGFKYCHRFGQLSHLFTPAGREWVNRVRRCLKNKLLANAVVIRNSNCQRILDIAFKTHPNCYVENGFCSIAKDNWRALQAVFDFGDLFSPKSIKQIYSTAKKCLGKFDL